jgi:hypothetical protein
MRSLGHRPPSSLCNPIPRNVRPYAGQDEGRQFWAQDAQPVFLPATVQLPAIPANRFVLQSVEHKPGNLAEQSRWQVILDFRPARSQRPSMGIDL